MRPKPKGLGLIFVYFRLLFETIEERGEAIDGGDLGLYLTSDEINGREAIVLVIGRAIYHFVAMTPHGDAVTVGEGQTLNDLCRLVVEVDDDGHTKACNVGVGIVGVEGVGKSVGIEFSVAYVVALSEYVHVIAAQAFDLSLCEVDAVRLVELRLSLFDARYACVEARNIAERAGAIDVEVALLVLKYGLIINRACGT